MLTKKSAILAALAFLAILCGVGLDSVLLVIASIPLIAYLLFSFVFSIEPGLDLSVNRSIDKNRAYEDESCRVMIEIVNNGSKIDFLEIVDTCT